MACISVHAGELAALRDEARMANKWAKEVRRLEEQLLASRAATKARGAPQQQQHGVHLNPQAGGGAALREIERAEYEQRLGEQKLENARLRERVERYKRTLVGMHKAAWEDAENPSASPHAIVPAHTPAPAEVPALSRVAEPLRQPPQGRGRSAAIELSQEREDAARREWLRAAKPIVHFDETRCGGGRGNGHPRGKRSVGTQVSAMAIAGDDNAGDHQDLYRLRHEEREREQIIAGLKAELLRQNARTLQAKIMKSH